MLKNIRKDLKKIFGEKEVEMSKKTETVAEDKGGALAAIVKDQIVASNDTPEFSALQEQIVALATQVETMGKQLADVTLQRDAVMATAKKEKETARLASLKSSVGDLKADALYAATANLNDEAFQAVVSALAGSVAVEAKTALFQEVGVAAEVDREKLATEGGKSSEMKILEAMYSKK